MRVSFDTNAWETIFNLSDVQYEPIRAALANRRLEWADGELVGAHIAYRNDVLCTNDFARGAGKSIFDPTNRLWLSAEFGVVFRTVDELVADAGSWR